MEIAEFLDSQAGDKYTVMVVRNGDDLDTANLVRVQMHEDSCESLRWVWSRNSGHLLIRVIFRIAANWTLPSNSFILWSNQLVIWERFE